MIPRDENLNPKMTTEEFAKKQRQFNGDIPENEISIEEQLKLINEAEELDEKYYGKRTSYEEVVEQTNKCIPTEASDLGGETIEDYIVRRRRIEEQKREERTQKLIKQIKYENSWWGRLTKKGNQLLVFLGIKDEEKFSGPQG